MKAHFKIILATSALILGACATAQENPNYQYSTQYKGQGQSASGDATTSYANYETQPAAQVTYALSQNAQDADSLPAKAYYYETAPTDQYYTGDDYIGTPGYQAVHGQPQEETPFPLYETPTDESEDYAQEAYAEPLPEGSSADNTGEQVVTQTISGPVMTASAPSGEIVGYDYSDNIISANAEAVPVTPSETRIIPATPNLGQDYIVQQGDTVYSLSRELCIGVDEIQTNNNLAADFGIKIGQNLSLPASRC